MKKEVWKYFIGLFRGFGRSALIAVLISMVQSLILIPTGLLIRKIFDEIIPAGESDSLLTWSLLIIALLFANSGLSLLTRHIILVVTKTGIKNLRVHMLDKVFSLPKKVYANMDLQDTHTVLVHDTSRVDNMANALLAIFIPSFLITIGLTAALVWVNWQLSLVLWAGAPVVYFVAYILGKKVKSRIFDFHRSIQTFSKGNDFILRKMDLSRIQSAEALEKEKMEAVYEDLRITSGARTWMDEAYKMSQETLVTILSIGVLLIGGGAVIGGYMTMGEVLSFYFILFLLKKYVFNMTGAIPKIMEGTRSMNALYKLLNLDERRPYAGTEGITFSGRIQLEDVHFSYGKEPLLQGIDLHIRPASFTALIGSNGSGKSTLISLLLGFYKPEKGSITADGNSYDILHIPGLRSQIGVVMQEHSVFAGTVKENILYGNPEAGEAEMTRAATLATADAFIRQLPKGYDTHIGESGTLLSGGQRQKIALARALIGSPRLLIFDEPTNHLDERSIGELIQNLRSLPDAPAILMISHNKDILEGADEMFQLADGYLEIIKERININ